MTANEIEHLLHPFIADAASTPPDLYNKLATYLELLLKWNARTNLTAIREPAEIVRRHFGESLFAAQHLEPEKPHGQQIDGQSRHVRGTLLDFGSGAGFPGLPIQLWRPEVQVTLAESQNKKAAFLREAVRTLGLETEVWSGRVEAMPPEARFDIVTLRAVDTMDAALAAASLRASRSLLLLTTAGQSLAVPAGFTWGAAISLPAAKERQLLRLDREAPLA